MLCSCSSPGGDGFGGQIGINQDAGSREDEQEPFDDENAPADEPTQISGAFLSMAFDETQDDTQKRIRDNPNGNVQIAACLRDKKTLQCVDMTGLSFQWELVTADRRYLPLQWTSAPKTYDFDIVLSVPVQHLAGTVLVKIDDRVSGKDAMRARTLTSVGEFGAKLGRADRAGEAQGRSFDAREEAAELGLPLAPPERLGQEAQVEVVEAAAEVIDNDDDDEQGFWAVVMGIIKDVFGEVYTVPVTTITTEPVVPCTTCGESVQFVVKPAPQIRPQASSISREPSSADAAPTQAAAGGGSEWDDGVWKPGQTPSSSGLGSGANPADPASDSESVSQPASSEAKADGGASSSGGSGTTAGDQGAGDPDGSTAGGDQGTGGTSGGTAGAGQGSAGTSGGTAGDAQGSGGTSEGTAGADQGSGGTSGAG
jgi:hypothetical protein